MSGNDIAENAADSGAGNRSDDTGRALLGASGL
jgi:hypothetical protein